MAILPNKAQEAPAEANVGACEIVPALQKNPDSPWSLKTFATGKDHLAHVRRVKEWVRARYSLTEDDTSMVSEVACELPGCPPLETVIAFWTEDGEKRHHYKIFKPLADVVEDDLPPYWMKNAMAVGDEFYCSCC